ncbi:MAG: hypothetical protein LBG07_07250 [Treponema sp.]|jgi:hypothetical protein|nr:hypothetical protein [Treponema sp.]
MGGMSHIVNFPLAEAVSLRKNKITNEIVFGLVQEPGWFAKRSLAYKPFKK